MVLSGPVSLSTRGRVRKGSKSTGSTDDGTVTSRAVPPLTKVNSGTGLTLLNTNTKGGRGRGSRRNPSSPRTILSRIQGRTLPYLTTGVYTNDGSSETLPPPPSSFYNCKPPPLGSQETRVLKSGLGLAKTKGVTI